MRYTLANFLRNVRAGARLACFLPVDRLAFRIDHAQVLLLFGLSAAIDFAGDWFRVTEPRIFSLLGFGSELFGGALLLLTAALIALLVRQRGLMLALSVVVLAALPLPQIVHYLAIIGLTDLVGFGAAVAIENLIIAWIVAVLIRSVAIAFSPAPPHLWLRAIGGGLLLASPIWFANALFSNEPWWREDAKMPSTVGGMNAGSEAVLAAQGFLLERALENLQGERHGQSDLYFVGFAPYGRQDVFRKDVEAAQTVMDNRWGTSGRSLVLLNNPQTLVTAPFATVTNLRETLNELGSIIDVEDDVVMLYLASHGGADHKLSASQWPLTLVELSPAGLKQLLDAAGIKWRIIVVSACFSGGYIPPLQDDHTMIVTASQADRISFGCGDRSDATFFGEAFFQQGLAKSDSFDAAFEMAKGIVGERERKEGYKPPSNPQIFVGAAMADKVKMLRKRGGGSTTAGAVLSRRPG